MNHYPAAFLPMAILQNFKVNLVRFVMLNKKVKKSTNFNKITCLAKQRGKTY